LSEHFTLRTKVGRAGLYEGVLELSSFKHEEKASPSMPVTAKEYTFCFEHVLAVSGVSTSARLPRYCYDLAFTFGGCVTKKLEYYTSKFTLYNIFSIKKSHAQCV
jgi:hypothetical protein